MKNGVKRFSVRLKNDELITFVNKQSNLNDTITYLLEKEIAENGIRDLQNVIPSKRDKSYFKKNKEVPINEWRIITKRFNW